MYDYVLAGPVLDVLTSREGETLGGPGLLGLGPPAPYPSRRRLRLAGQRQEAGVEIGLADSKFHRGRAADSALLVSQQAPAALREGERPGPAVSPGATLLRNSR